MLTLVLRCQPTANVGLPTVTGQANDSCPNLSAPDGRRGVGRRRVCCWNVCLERGGVKPFPSAQAEATEEATVRISAKRLADGRTELGLQIKQEGEWSAERLKPTGRFIPTNAQVDREYRSGPLELESGHVVRIAAQLLESGQIEVGLREVVDGELGERLPLGNRLFPRSPTVGVWHNTLQLVLADPNPPELPPGYTPLVGASGWVSESIDYSSSYDENGVQTRVVSRVASENAPDGALFLTQACWNSNIHRLQIDGLPGPAGAMLVMTDEIDGTSTAERQLVEVEVALGDGDEETQFWQLIGPTERPTASAEAYAPDLLEAMREAASLTVTLVGSGLPSATFDLTGMFDTPVQGNIDECGNYADPAWTPVTEEQSGTTEAGATYSVRYPEWSDGERFTQISVLGSERTSDSDGPSVDLWVYCWPGGDRDAYINQLPIAVGTHTVRSRVDDSEWAEQELTLRDQGNERSSFTVVEDYEALRNGSTLEVEILSDPIWQGSFDLAALFSTPVQTNIDNCGVPVWPEPEPTYVPLVNVDGSVSDSLAYRAYQAGDGVYSEVTNSVAVESAPRGSIEFVNLCSPWGGWHVTLGHFDLTDAGSLDVTLEIEGLSLPAEPWRVSTTTFAATGTQLSEVVAPDNGRLVSSLRGASSLTVTIDGSGLPPVTFDLTGMFDTPIQENIDECGNYVPGETRELTSTGTYVPLVNVNGQVSETISYSARERDDRVHTQVANTVAVDSAHRGEVELSIRCLGGTTLWTYIGWFDVTDADSLAVTLEVDGVALPAETWSELTTAGSDGVPVASAVQSRNPNEFITRIRGASSLTVTIDGSGLPPVTFDVTGMFDTPVQENIDECGNYVPGETRELTSTGTYVPLVNVNGQVSESIWYYLNQWDDQITSTVTSISDTVGYEDVPVGLAYSCSQGERTILSFERFSPLEPGEYDVTFSLDGSAAEAATWTSEPVGFDFSTGEILNSQVLARDLSLLIARLRGASSLTIEIPATGLGPITFDLTGMFDTPIQENIDECGNYKPGETRELEDG